MLIIAECLKKNSQEEYIICNEVKLKVVSLLKEVFSSDNESKRRELIVCYGIYEKIYKFLQQPKGFRFVLASLLFLLPFPSSKKDTSRSVFFSEMEISVLVFLAELNILSISKVRLISPSSLSLYTPEIQVNYALS